MPADQGRDATYSDTLTVPMLRFDWESYEASTRDVF